MNEKLSFHEPEVRIFTSGMITILVLILWLSLSYLWLPGRSHIMFIMAAIDFSCGRLAGMFFGYSSGLKQWMIVPTNFLVDSIWILILYPLVILSLKKFLSIEYISKKAKHIETIANDNRDKIEKYGIIGLFLFVFVPLPMTGPVVGGVIGYFMNLRPWTNIAVILSATYVTIIVWALLLPHIHHVAQGYGPNMPMILLVVLILLGFIGRIFYKRKTHGHAK